MIRVPSVQIGHPAPPVVPMPLLFIDYDGTLASIVDRPMEAEPYPGVPELLRDLDEQYPLWIVTGRHVDDLAVFLPELPLHAIGLHGAQEGRIGGQTINRVDQEVQDAMDRMRAQVPEMEGITVEAKGPMFAAHYRQADDEQRAYALLKEWAESAPVALDVLWGKKVVEVRAKGTHKGVAVQHICEDFPEHTPVYLGDDETDEDAFRALHALGDRAVTVRVGGGETVARHTLKGPPQVVAYLRQYL